MANKPKGIKALLGCTLVVDCKACRKYLSCLLKAVEMSEVDCRRKEKRKPWVIGIE